MSYFYVTTKRGKLKVILLPTVDAVHRKFDGQAKYSKGFKVHAFFTGSTRAGSLGSITLPIGDKHILELIAHECTHAAIDLERRTREITDSDGTYVEIDGTSEERIAILVGELTYKVITKLTARQAHGKNNRRSEKVS